MPRGITSVFRPSPGDPGMRAVRRRPLARRPKGLRNLGEPPDSFCVYLWTSRGPTCLNPVVATWRLLGEPPGRCAKRCPLLEGLGEPL